MPYKNADKQGLMENGFCGESPSELTEYRRKLHRAMVDGGGYKWADEEPTRLRKLMENP